MHDTPSKCVLHKSVWLISTISFIHCQSWWDKHRIPNDCNDTEDRKGFLKQENMKIWNYFRQKKQIKKNIFAHICSVNGGLQNKGLLFKPNRIIIYHIHIFLLSLHETWITSLETLSYKIHQTSKYYFIFKTGAMNLFCRWFEVNHPLYLFKMFWNLPLAMSYGSNESI